MCIWPSIKEKKLNNQFMLVLKPCVLLMLLLPPKPLFQLASYLIMASYPIGQLILSPSIVATGVRLKPGCPI